LQQRDLPESFKPLGTTFESHRVQLHAGGAVEGIPKPAWCGISAIIDMVF